MGDRLGTENTKASRSDLHAALPPPCVACDQPADVQEHGSDRKPAGRLRASDSNVAARFRFMAMWDVRRKAITTFVCLQEDQAPDGSVRLGYQTFENPGDPAHIAQVDLATLCHAAREIGAVLADGGKAVVVCLVHAATLDRQASRDWYLSACNNLPAAVRRHLVISIVGLPPDAASSRVSRLVCMVRSQCRAVFVQTSLAARSLSNLPACGVMSVSVELDSMQARRPDFAASLDRFAANAGIAGLQAIAGGVSSTSIALQCIGAGFNYVNGPLLGGARLERRALLHFTLADLYRKPPRLSVPVAR